MCQCIRKPTFSAQTLDKNTLILYSLRSVQVPPQEHEQQLTQSNAPNTSRRNNETKSKSFPRNYQQPPIYDSIATKPSAMQQTIVSSSSNLYSTLDHRNTSSSFASSSIHFNTMLKPFAPQNIAVEFRKKSNRGETIDEHRLSSGSDITVAGNCDFVNLSNHSIASRLLLPNSNGSNASKLHPAARRHMATLDRDRSIQNNNRNHIITDSLPGPESCV